MISEFVLYAPEPASVSVIRCSPPSWMVQLLLEEKGCSYRVRHLSFAAGEHRTPEMLAKNPRGTIPVLSHGSLNLYESFAMLEYIEACAPKTPFLPPDLHDRGIALNRLHESNTLKSAGMTWFVLLMRDGSDEAVRLARSAFEDELRFWESYLTSTPWVAGHTLTLADLSIFTYVATAVHLGLQLTDLPHMENHYHRLRSRTSTQATWPWD
jgi:glutathione S-transferase